MVVIAKYLWGYKSLGSIALSFKLIFLRIQIIQMLFTKTDGFLSPGYQITQDSKDQNWNRLDSLISFSPAVLFLVCFSLAISLSKYALRWRIFLFCSLNALDVYRIVTISHKNILREIFGKNVLKIFVKLPGKHTRSINLNDCKGTQTHNHLVCKGTLHHLTKKPDDWAVLWMLYCIMH